MTCKFFCMFQVFWDAIMMHVAYSKYSAYSVQDKYFSSFSFIHLESCHTRFIQYWLGSLWYIRFIRYRTWMQYLWYWHHQLQYCCCLKTFDIELSLILKFKPLVSGSYHIIELQYWNALLRYLFYYLLDTEGHILHIMPDIDDTQCGVARHSPCS